MKGKDHHSISFKMLLYFLKHMNMYIEGKNVLHLLLWYICRRLLSIEQGFGGGEGGGGGGGQSLLTCLPF